MWEVLAGVGLALIISSCGGDSKSTIPSVVTFEIDTPTQELTEAVEDVSETAFSQDDVEILLEYLEADIEQYGWAAGCLWPEGTNDDFTLYPAELLGLDVSSYASGTWGFTAGAHAATVFRPEYSGPVVGGLGKVEGDGYLCYAPQ